MTGPNKMTAARSGATAKIHVLNSGTLQTERSLSSSKRIAERRSDMPRQYRKLYDRCMAGKASPRDAIKMHCLECWGWVKGETEKCDNYACPLYRYRPYQSPVKSSTEPLGAPSTDERALTYS